ncbi:MAG: hypothetical protein KTR31_26320 [Myxococcales bacterium]|nr:hypothetical protein [Myxococcales bacterium]
MWMWMVGASFAGELFINDVPVEPRSVAGVSLEKVDVVFDDQGNIRITAPGYRIEVVPPTSPTRSAKPAAQGGVPDGRYWLVTEDNGSAGHVVECWINGALAQTLRSGDPQRIVDVAKWLTPGSNRVQLKSVSTNASGGSFYVFLGRGSTRDGTVMMDDPTVQFGVGPTREGAYERTFQMDASAVE